MSAAPGSRAHLPARGQPRLAVRRAGAGEGLVLLHGLASSARYWGRPLPLSDRYRVVAPDLLGFGRSPSPAGGAYTPAAHLAALDAALAGRVAAPFNLLGHSLGSLLALHRAAAAPESVRRLILVSLPVLGGCAWGHHGPEEMGRFHRFSVHTAAGQRLFGLGMRLLHPAWRVVGPRLRPDAPPESVADSLAGSWPAYWRTLEEVVYGTDVPALLARVRAPVTVIHGPHDTVAPVSRVRELAAALPALRLVEIAGAGHNPYYSHRAATLAALEAALTG